MKLDDEVLRFSYVRVASDDAFAIDESCEL